MSDSGQFRSNFCIESGKNFNFTTSELILFIVIK
jgi:hypothetical protein